MEEEPRSFRRKHPGIFPEPNYTKFKDLLPVAIFDLILDEGIFTAIATKSNEYGLKEFGLQPNITPEEVRTFFGILLLSGVSQVTDYRMYWSNSELTENKMIKNAMSRDRFLLVKRCFHLMGTSHTVPKEGETRDR